MKCIQCGSELMQGASFCGKCGSAIVIPEKENNETKRLNSRYAWLCVILGMLLLYYIIGLYIMDAQRIGSHCGSPFNYDPDTLLWCMIWRMYEVAIIVIALSCIQLRTWYKNKKAGMLKVGIATRIAGFFAIAASYGGLVGTMGWFFWQSSCVLYVSFYIAFGLYCAGCVMTAVCGVITLFTRGTGKKKKILCFVRHHRDKKVTARKKNLQ